MPLLVAGTGAGELTRGVGAAGPWVERVSGTALLGLGFYLIFTAA